MSALRRVGSLAPGEGRRLGLAIALATGATAAAIALLATSGYLITRAAHRPQVIALTVAITAVRGFGLARAALRYAERLASHELTLRQLTRLRCTFFARLAPLIPGRLARRGRGELLARFVADVDTMADLYLRVLIPVLVAMAVIVVCAGAGALMLGGLGLVLALALAADAVGSTWLAHRVGGVSARRQGPVRAELTGRLVEAIDGSGELALAGRTHDTVAGLRGLDAELARLGRRDALASSASGSAHALLGAAGLLAVLLVAIAGVHGHTLSGLLLAAAVFLFLGAGEAIGPLPRAAARARACHTAAQRLSEICDTPAPVLDPPPGTQAALSGTGALAVDDVSLRYGPREAPVLEHVTLTIAPGEHVALVGPSGAGKSSLAELLVRFRDPDAGAITLDTVDIRQIGQERLRAEVLLAGQDAHLFNTTLRENLTIARPGAAQPELTRVLGVVGLGDWLAGLPRGLDTRVGQYGMLVSGGQRQRIALARALLSPARFLILDEPTAHLDAALAEAVTDRLLDFAGDRGVLVITHDLTALERFDRVLECRDGRVLEPGPVPV